jgi:hypothetical protein
MTDEAHGTIVVNLHRTFEETVPHSLDVFSVAAVPVTGLEGFDRLDGLEAGDSVFQIGQGHVGSPTT